MIILGRFWVIAEAPGRSEGQKSDARDAWALAEQLRNGAVERRVFKRPRAFTQLRDAVRGYRLVTQDIVRTKNRIKAIYRSRGIQGTGEEVYNADKRRTWLNQLPESNRGLAELLGLELDALTELQARAEKRLNEEANRQAAVKLLATAPAIGLIRAATVVAVVVTPDRFRTKRQFWSYCGLGIVTRSSADWVRENGKWVRAEVNKTRGLNRNRNPWLKEVFKGAAMGVITRLPTHPLHKDYQRLLENGTKPNLARLTLARRIASAVLAMWKNQEAYDPAKHRKQQAA